MKRYRKVLFLGTGGGNDIFSTVLAALSLPQFGITFASCDIGGIISPFHKHTVKPTGIQDVNITEPNSKRYLIRRGMPNEIPLVDSFVSRMIEENAFLKINKVFSFSIERGTRDLARSLRLLFKKENYGLLVLVDIGGDIFFRGKEDKHILSPMFDAIILKATTESKLPCRLFEAGLGTDGEMELKAFQQMSLLARGTELLKENLDLWEELYNQWIVKVRPGRTVPITAMAFRNNGKIGIIDVDYRARAHIGNRREYHYFQQRISTNLASQCFLVDPALIKNPFAVSCRNPFDWFLKTQSKIFTNNEANLEYWQLGKRKLMQFLTPSPLFSQETRHSLIKDGIRDLENGAYDKALIFHKDWQEGVGRKNSLAAKQQGKKFVLVERR